MHVMHHADDLGPASQRPRREERYPVLAIDNGVKGPTPSREPGQHARIDGVTTAHSHDVHLVAALAPGLTRYPRRNEPHRGAALAQALGDLPGVALGASCL